MRARPDSSSIDTASWITLRWTRGTRYFRVHLEQNLWHQWLLTQVNGRSGTGLGRHRATPAASIEDCALAAGRPSPNDVGSAATTS
jgi:hypothetical protein